MRCPGCGRNVPRAFPYCDYCGARLAPAAKTNGLPAWAKWMIAFGLAIIATIVAQFVMPGAVTPPPAKDKEAGTRQPAGGWVSLASAPSIMDYSASTRTGDDYIYACEGELPNYYRYSVSENSWTALAPIPDDKSRPYHDLIYLGGANLYVLDGWGTEGPGIWSYYIPNDSWSRLTSFPGKVSDGQVYGGTRSVGARIQGKDYIYVQDASKFWRYSVSDDSWETMAAMPPYDSVMAWDGGDSIYGLSSIYATAEFWRYSISGDSWATLEPAPGEVKGAGTCLALADGDHVYAARGGIYDSERDSWYPTQDFWRYSVSSDNWEVLDSLPEGVSWGGSLVATTDGIYILIGGTPGRFYFLSTSS
jgi:hypothetical protein